jgi:catechol 2,3-dioxygenase-like lactoylglutathione lyase family enzyme
MDLKKCSAALFVKDIEISKRFYSGVLGLTIQSDFGKNIIYSCGLTIWEINGSHIIPTILGQDNISDQRSNCFELYFESESLRSGSDMNPI